MNSCNIIESDGNDDTLIVWIYPSIKPEQRSYVLNKFKTFQNYSSSFFGRYESEWFYSVTSPVSNTENLPLVKKVGFVLWANDFNPKKYEKLCSILLDIYCQTGDPTKVLAAYLSVFMKGSIKGVFSAKDFESLSSKLENNLIKSLVCTFQLEFVLIYLAILLKKKLVFFSHSFEDLLCFIQVIPLIINHRNNASILHPFVDFEDDLLTLEKSEYYIAGCCDESIFASTNLFDVLVDISNTQIIVADDAKDSLIPTKSSKEIAKYVVILANDENSTDDQIVTEISNKTEELLSQLRSLADTEDQKISIKMLKEKKLSPVVENFLLQLAVSENLLKID